MNRLFERKSILLVGVLALCVACNETPKNTNSSPKGGVSMKAGTGTGGNHLGKPFALKTTTTLDALLKDPKKFEGKTVHVAGVLTAHCHHRRAWFAIRKTPDSPTSLRVMTRPAFLVPKDVKHNQTRAQAEGVVAIRTIDEKYAKHYAKEHGLFGGDPAKVTGPQYIVSLQATGASFQ